MRAGAPSWQVMFTAKLLSTTRVPIAGCNGVLQLWEVFYVNQVL